MSYESGSLECRRLVESKESLIKIIQALDSLEDLEHIVKNLRSIYKEIDDMHEERKKLEKSN